MARLIDADALLAKLREMDELMGKQARKDDAGFLAVQAGITLCVCEAEDAPTVNALTMMHGKWVSRADGILEKCSLCGKAGFSNWVYCPGCGAKMDKQRLEEIRARCEAATRGPWRTEPDGKIISGRDTIADLWARISSDGELWDGGIRYPNQNDADFIAHARQDIPDLLAEVERLTRERDAAVKTALVMAQFINTGIPINCETCTNGMRNMSWNPKNIGCDGNCRHDNGKLETPEQVLAYFTEEAERRGLCAENGGDV